MIVKSRNRVGDLKSVSIENGKFVYYVTITLKQSKRAKKIFPGSIWMTTIKCSSVTYVGDDLISYKMCSDGVLRKGQKANTSTGKDYMKRLFK